MICLRIKTVQQRTFKYFSDNWITYLKGQNVCYFKNKTVCIKDVSEDNKIIAFKCTLLETIQQDVQELLMNIDQSEHFSSKIKHVLQVIFNVF